ncbi:DinB family protein [Phytoactinopolyspora halotolerans]|uniref:DinB family protein n=1 Tax=Phytoactinopolyspora halotolerans TaxID=1981512 RepID=A0A6L9SGS7_9ACTN|nr:DinB family protein [Phytoactinopolyspora halotolerans]NEE03814.1 DinB family protein [Phytoactinopolyspora halotolerans]
MDDDHTAGRDLASELQRYLQQGRDNLVAKLEGLSEYDIRRPMTPSGTNLLGLVKHLIGIELGYLGACVGRPAPVTLPWVEDGSVWESADMWAKADESRHYLVDLYRTAWRHSDESIERLGLTAAAHVPWWPEERRDTTLGALLVRTATETAQHAGHADIVREMIDGRGGKDHDDMGDARWWSDYVGRIQNAADAFRNG